MAQEKDASAKIRPSAQLAASATKEPTTQPLLFTMEHGRAGEMHNDDSSSGSDNDDEPLSRRCVRKRLCTWNSLRGPGGIADLQESFGDAPAPPRDSEAALQLLGDDLCTLPPDLPAMRELERHAQYLATQGIVDKTTCEKSMGEVRAHLECLHVMVQETGGGTTWYADYQSSIGQETGGCGASSSAAAAAPVP